MIRSNILYIVLFTFCYIGEAYSQRTIQLETTLLQERELAIGLNVPWEMLWGPDDHIWLTERHGVMKRINPVTGNTTTILDYRSKVLNIVESGMLGFCFHPDFNNNNLIFVAYDFGPDDDNLVKTISTFEWNGTTLENEKKLIENIPALTAHSGCRMIISNDNKLLFTLGDIFQFEIAQDLDSPLGKMHRYNLDGSIPDDNPIPGSSIYSFGHRNSQGLAYGPNGNLYASEHGDINFDELNIMEPNRNYGWPNVEGVCNTTSETFFCNQNNVKEPIFEWSPCVAVNDLCYYNHEAIPEWKGKMLIAILGGFIKDPSLSVISFNATGEEVTQVDEYFKDYGRIRDVCINPHTGSIYFATNGGSYPSRGPNRIIEYFNPEFETSTEELEFSTDQFLNVSPNPISQSQKLDIEMSDSFIGSQIELYSMNGEKIKTLKSNSKNFILETNLLSTGAYFIKASNKKGIITKKIIIK